MFGYKKWHASDGVLSSYSLLISDSINRQHVSKIKFIILVFEKIFELEKMSLKTEIDKMMKFNHNLMSYRCIKCFKNLKSMKSFSKK